MREKDIKSEAQITDDAFSRAKQKLMNTEPDASYVEHIAFFPNQDFLSEEKLAAILSALTSEPISNLNVGEANANQLPSCNHLEFGNGPEYEIRFWGHSALGNIDYQGSELIAPSAIIETAEGGVIANPAFTNFLINLPEYMRAKNEIQLAGTTVDFNNTPIIFALRYHFTQRWFFKKLVLGDIASTISLGPSERAEIEIKKTQRKSLQTTTLRQIDEMLSTESTLIDKDVLNATRTSSIENKWSLSLDASFKVFGIGANSKAEYQGSATNRAERTVQQIREATRKSAHTLKLLQKTEVILKTENITEERSARVLQNPYFDRSLTLQIFDIKKRYDVQTRFDGLQAALIIDLSRLNFTSDFVLRNRDFIIETLLDRDLIQIQNDAEIGDIAPISSINRQLAHEYVEEAFKFLFSDSIKIFKRDNTPKESFEGTGAHWDAMINNATGIILSMTVYYHWFITTSEEQRKKNDDAIYRAIALESYIGPKWENLSDTGEDSIVKHLADYDEPTEVFRRIPGFLSIINGIVKPLIGEFSNNQKEAEESDKSKKASNTPAVEQNKINNNVPFAKIFQESAPEERIALHMNSFRLHYVTEYLRYLDNLSEGIEIRGFILNLLQRLAQKGQFAKDIMKKLDIDQVFVSGTEIIIPALGFLNNDELRNLKIIFPENIFDSVPNVIDLLDSLEVPADGIHIEPISGNCELKGIEKVRIGQLNVKDFIADIQISQNASKEDKGGAS